jgi:hypothetical protein
MVTGMKAKRREWLNEPSVSYVRWLLARHPDWKPLEARAYAEQGGGEAGLAAIARMRGAAPPRTQREREAAREADMGEDGRRWRRFWQGCPVKGCILPAGHAEAHKYPSQLGTRLAAADGETELLSRCGDIE